MIPHAFAKKDDEESIVSYDYEKAKQIKWYDKILLNRPLRVVFCLAIASILAPTLVYQLVFFRRSNLAPPDGLSYGSCLIPRDSRIPCGLGNVSQSECSDHCCFDPDNGLCYHKFPSRFSLVVPHNSNWTEESLMTPRFAALPFKSQISVPNVRLSIDEITSTHMSLTFYDPRNMSLTGSRLDEKAYNYIVSTPEFSLAVYANGNESIFNTMRGPLIASDNIWEIAFKLTDQSMYGLGEVPLERGTTKVIYSHAGGFSSIPLIFARVNESYHGLLVDVTDPTQISVAMDNRVIVRSITRSGLKFHLFTGPEPKDIMRDVMSLIGSKGQLDYWMLGAHVCSDMGMEDADALSHLTSFIANATTSEVPYESHCGTKPIVFSPQEEGTTVVADGATALKNAQRRFVPHIAPYIRYKVQELVSYENSTAELNETMTCSDIVCEFEDVWIRAQNEERLDVYTGLVDDFSVIYPDYTRGNSTGLLDKLWTHDIALDGVLLDNNWPLDESVKANNETYEALPYYSENFEKAFNRTPQWDARMPQGNQYIYHHNQYGSHFMEALKKKLETSAAWSTSQWMRADAVVNRQNVQTTWLSLRQELVAAALGGISGQWLWSTPVCGDTEDFDLTRNASLCIKWYLAGTYFPMINIHSKTVPRDPVAFEGTQRNIIINALKQRISLMPYFYTVLQEGPLLRPMFYQYPFSDLLVDLGSQFSVGDDLLIAPNLLPSQSHVHIRMPPGTWYEFWSGLKLESEEGDYVTLTTTEADFVTLIRGGSIVPMQKTVSTTADLTRKNSDYTLIVATERANITEDNGQIVETSYAEGHFRLTTNLFVSFLVHGEQLLITASGDDFSPMCDSDLAVWNNMIKAITIYGYPATLNNFDNYRHINIPEGIDLCLLKGGQSIGFPLV